jgi:alpha/beta superfamily hydrolase
VELVSDGLRLQAHLARPHGSAAGGARSRAGLLIAHPFPDLAQSAARGWSTYPELADRIATDDGWVCMTVALRGIGDSEGDFSLGGWLRDLRAGLRALLAEPDVAGVWLCGFGLGGLLALCLAATDPRVLGVASFAAPADVDDWAAEPRKLLEQARAVGVVRDSAFPADFDRWAAELRDTRPLRLIHRIPPRPLLIVHGSEDDKVPLVDARALVDAADGQADLRVVSSAGHQLRHDPRAIAVLLGWLDREVTPLGESQP